MSRSLHWLIILSLVVILALTPTTSWASYRWSFGDNRYWTVDEEQVCRDGAAVLAFHRDSTIPDGTLSAMPLHVASRLYSNPDLPPPDESGSSDDPLAAYGPLLGGSHTFTMTYHDEPWPPSFTDQPNDMYMYTRGELRWFPVEPNARILIQSNFGESLFDVQVQDCFLNPPNLLEVGYGSLATIDSSHLNLGYGMGNALPTHASIFFQLDALPAYGTLRLNDAELEVGDVFTQADIDDNRLTYAHNGTHNGNAPTADSFAFHVEGTARVSVDSAGTEANAASFDPSLTGDGRKVVFASDATNLIVNDSNLRRDIFVHDLELGQTVRVSVAGNETQADGPSNAPRISSAFGNPIAFESEATNLAGEECLVYEDQDGVSDVFLLSHFLERMSVSATPSGSGNCYQGTQNSHSPAIAAYGSTVAFVSDATNLLLRVDNDDNVSGKMDDNGVSDIYLQSTPFDGARIVSVPTGESGLSPELFGNGSSYAPSISADGRIVAFQSDATNLVAGDTNGVSDIFVRSQDQTVRVSLAADGTDADAASHAPAISANGRYVAFHSAATNLVASTIDGGMFQVFVYDRDREETSLISVASDGTQGNGDSRYSAISYTGRFVAFQSNADNLVPADENNLADIFVHDRDADSNGIFDEPGAIRTTRVSVATTGSNAMGASVGTPAISADGHVVAFASMADNLVMKDANAHQDVFVHHIGHSHIFALEISPLTVRFPWVSLKDNTAVALD